MPKKHKKASLTAPDTLPPPAKNGKAMVLTPKPVAVIDEDEWQKKVASYRKDSTIADALSLANHDRFRIDAGELLLELRGYLVYASRKKSDARAIRVETLEVALEALQEMLHYKDRTGSLQIELSGMRAQLGSLYDACANDLALRKSVMGLRTVGDRGAVVEQVLRRIRKRLNAIDSVLESCELVTKTLRDTYNILHLQVEIVKLIVYKRPDGAMQLTQTTTARGTIAHVKSKVREQ